VKRIERILRSFLAGPPRPRIVEPDPIGDAIRDAAEANGISPAALRQAIRDRLEQPT